MSWLDDLDEIGGRRSDYSLATGSPRPWERVQREPVRKRTGGERAANAAYARAMRAEYKRRGECVRCGDSVVEGNVSYCAKHREESRAKNLARYYAKKGRAK